MDGAPYPDIAQTMAALRERGRPVAVFTGASTRAAQILLGAAGLEADIVIGGDQVDRPKPAADGMLLAARRLTRRPRTWWVTPPWTSRPLGHVSLFAKPECDGAAEDDAASVDGGEFVVAVGQSRAIACGR